MAYDWPGNIRELRNAIERALLLGTSEVIQPEDLPESLRETIESDDPSKNSLNSRVNAFKRAVFLEALQKTGGNVPEAARLLDISHSYLSRSIRSFKIQLP